jgi:riboflavin synthase
LTDAGARRAAAIEAPAAALARSRYKPDGMFTGLVQDMGTVERVHPGGTCDFWINTRLGAPTFERGESIAVEGVCLTVVERAGDAFLVQAAQETLRRTTLESLRAGDRVNLERALRLGDRLGGHLVQGHVDAVGELLSRRSEGSSWVLTFSLPSSLRTCFIEKGSVCIDGVSLTVTQVEPDRFSVMLIPETQARTTLGHKSVGARVNLEGDLIGKYVARLYALGERPGEAAGMTQAMIDAAGFRSKRE